MNDHAPCVYDQGFFNAACGLVEEVVPRNYIYFNLELDVSGMDAFRAAARRAGRTVPSYTAFVIKAAGSALRAHPQLNCMIQETPFSTRLVPLPNVTATVAVERLVDGVDMVFAPALASPEQRTLADLTTSMQYFANVPVDNVPAFAEFRKLTWLARWLPSLVGAIFRIPALSSRLWCKYRGGAFAVTSPGKYGGADAILAPWPWPLTFLFGTVKSRPWVKDGCIVACRTMRLTIAADRRLANGAPLARFAELVRQTLESPEMLEKAVTAPNLQEVPLASCVA